MKKMFGVKPLSERRNEGMETWSYLYNLLVQHLALLLPVLSETFNRCPEFSAGYGG